jgi:DNA-binding transcriptional LysR family regulator
VMHEPEKSDSVVVAEKPTNKAERSAAEPMEPRAETKANATPAGREFVAVAERVLNDQRISVRSMRDLADQQRGQVIVAAIESVATGLLPRIIAEYHITRPAIELRVREGVHGAVLEDVRSGVADLGITFVDELPDTIAMVPLGREVFHAVTQRQHRLAALRGITHEADRPRASLSRCPTIPGPAGP